MTIFVVKNELSAMVKYPKDVKFILKQFLTLDGLEDIFVYLSDHLIYNTFLIWKITQTKRANARLPEQRKNTVLAPVEQKIATGGLIS